MTHFRLFLNSLFASHVAMIRRAIEEEELSDSERLALCAVASEAILDTLDKKASVHPYVRAMLTDGVAH